MTTPTIARLIVAAGLTLAVPVALGTGVASANQTPKVLAGTSGTTTTTSSTTTTTGTTATTTSTTTASTST
ncbi:MAG: hypothetical protein ACYDEN_08910, partial [Acidimicrobiales bacterium]